MSRPSLPPDDSWESDPVWKLLDQCPAPLPRAGFLDDALRAARLHEKETPWWRRLVAPAPLGLLGACGAAAALSFALLSPSPAPPAGSGPLAFQETEQETLAVIEELAETEALMAALDQMDDYSDHELVRLIGF